MSSKQKITLVTFTKPMRDPTGRARSPITEVREADKVDAAFCAQGIKFPNAKGYVVVGWTGLESWHVEDVKHSDE